MNRMVSSRRTIGLALIGSLLMGFAMSAVSAQGVGTVWAWGANPDGELGNGTTADSNLAVEVSGLSGIRAVSAGASHGLALKQDGSVWAWGFNGDGELGNGSNNSSTTPVRVSGITTAIAIAAGDCHSLALTSDGHVLAWGSNANGQLGNGSLSDSNVPVTVSNLSGITAIAAGGAATNGFSLALKQDGSVWAWGYNTEGELGDGSNSLSDVAVQLTGLPKIQAIACGEVFGLALTQSGAVWAWGDNVFGELGSGSTVGSSNTPVQVTGLSGIQAVSAGFYHALALASDGTVHAWGLNGNGQLGNNTETNSAAAVTVANLSGVTAIAAGTFHSLALMQDGTVQAWGFDASGELGDGTNVDSPVPVQVLYTGSVKSLSAGGGFSLAVVRSEPFDLDGDGNNDLVWQNTVTGEATYWLMNGPQFKTWGYIEQNLSADWRIVAQFRSTDPANPYLVWQNNKTGDVTYWQMNGTAFSGNWAYMIRGLDPAWNVVAFADIDGDGVPDLVFQNSTTGGVTWVQLASDGIATGIWGYLVQGIPPAWQVIGAVDLTGDGIPDLEWWNSQTGDVTYYQMDGTAYSGTWGYIDQGVTTIWRPVGLGDYTGDGMPDLVWQNTQTGDVTYLTLNGAQYTGAWGYLALNVPPNWRVAGMR